MRWDFYQRWERNSGFPGDSVSKESACNAGRACLQGRSSRFDLWAGKIPSVCNPLQYFYLENPMNRWPWQATVHRVARTGNDLANKPPPLPRKKWKWLLLNSYSFQLIWTQNFRCHSTLSCGHHCPDFTDWENRGQKWLCKEYTCCEGFCYMLHELLKNCSLTVHLPTPLQNSLFEGVGERHLTFTFNSFNQYIRNLAAG